MILFIASMTVGIYAIWTSDIEMWCWRGPLVVD